MGIENLTPKEMRSRKRKRPLSTFYKEAISSVPVGDPFDCTSMTILPTQDLVENIIQDYLEEWKKLEDRKISKPRDEPQENESETEDSIPTKQQGTNHGGGWRAREDRLLLPDGFDYNRKGKGTENTENEALVPDDFSGDVVISLKNPTQRLSYCSELSKLFDSIPSCQELENEARFGHKVDHSLELYQETHDPTNIPDSYTIARLKVPDRHGLPQSLPSQLEAGRNRGSDSTVLLEFWRKNPKPHVSGCHRMVVEFLTSQSLWDVHVILSQMVEDELWEGGDGDDKALAASHGNDSVEKTLTMESCDENQDDNVDNKGDCQQHRSGCFFIESTFYKTGSVDYAKPIIDWIEGSDSNDVNAIRKTYLGINCIQHTKEMKTTKLSQVPFRDNVRYYHACHGDVETTVLFVDRKTIFRNGNGNITIDRALFPLMHDMWIAPRSPAVPICDACQIYQSVFKTATTCKTTDGGPHSLCQECFQDLDLLRNERNSVKFYREWHDQAILTNRIAPDNNTSI